MDELALERKLDALAIAVLDLGEAISTPLNQPIRRELFVRAARRRVADAFLDEDTDSLVALRAQLRVRR